MKAYSLIAFLLLSFSSFSQENDEYMLWTELGLEGDLMKRTDWSFELNSRFDNQGVATFFPQVGIDYKVTKWFKPSVEYRFIVDRNKYGNYKSSHRINVNAKLEERVSRFELGLRLRYQYAFAQFGAPTDYNADFDQAFRIKPEITYDINNSIFSPFVQAEFFYNPQIGEDGRQFDKVRLAVGSKLELNGPHSVSFKYQLDKKFHDYPAGLRHVFSISYGYQL